MDRFIPLKRQAICSEPQSMYTQLIFNAIDSPTRSLTFSPRKKRDNSAKILEQATKYRRNIPLTPHKILDAPNLLDDYYVNLIDWSNTNLLAVALQNSMYILNMTTNKVQKLFDAESICSVKFYQKYLIVGLKSGEILLWDMEAQKLEQTIKKHKCRVGVLSFTGSTIISGSRDCSIRLSDYRSKASSSIKLHDQEVCGMKWSVENNLLATGGNDNKLFITDLRVLGPLFEFQHQAAIKAIAWSPHQRGVVASGGGSTCRKIKIWNLNSEKHAEHDTQSQVCNLHWSSITNEIISTHGFSQNELAVWRYPTMQRIAVLMGHQRRVVQFAVSPDERMVVSGAGGIGDETLRFWNLYEPKKPPMYSSVLTIR